MTDRVQFREEDEVLQFFQREGLNPNEVARELLRQEYRRRKAEKWLAAVRAAKVNLNGAAAALVREDRDHGHD